MAFLFSNLLQMIKAFSVNITNFRDTSIIVRNSNDTKTNIPCLFSVRLHQCYAKLGFDAHYLVGFDFFLSYLMDDLQIAPDINCSCTSVI